MHKVVGIVSQLIIYLHLLVFIDGQANQHAQHLGSNLLFTPFNFFSVKGVSPNLLQHRQNGIRHLITGVSGLLAYFSYGSNYKLILKSHALIIDDRHFGRSLLVH